MPSVADGIDSNESKNSSGCLSEPEELKKNSTGIEAKFEGDHISKIQQGSFDSSFDDSFILRVKADSKMEESKSDTGVGSITFGDDSISFNSGDHDFPNWMKMAGVKLKATSDGENNTFAAKILGFKVIYMYYYICIQF